MASTTLSWLRHPIQACRDMQEVLDGSAGDGHSDGVPRRGCLHAQRRAGDLVGVWPLLERLEHRPSGAASARCPLCVSREKAETMAMDTLVMHLSEPELLDRIAKSDGLCQRHLEVALARCHDSAALIDAQATARGRLVKDLDELIRKHDYRFSGEADKVEGQAWLRAVAAGRGP